MEITPNELVTCPHGKPQSYVSYAHISLNDAPFCLECRECRLAQIEDCETNNLKEEVLDIVLDGYPNAVLYHALKEKGY